MAVMCRTCKKIKELCDFTKNNQRKNGYDTKCKSCHSKYQKKYKVGRKKENAKIKKKIIKDAKFCNKCFELKKIEFYHCHFSSPDGYRHICKECARFSREEKKIKIYESLRYKSFLFCSFCIKIKKTNEFTFKGVTRAKHQCKLCANKIARSRVVSSAFKITKTEFNNLLKLQNNVCAICLCPETRALGNSEPRLCVDHCHKNKKIRGLLCRNCNSAIGMLKDSKEIIMRAASYVDKYD